MLHLLLTIAPTVLTVAPTGIAWQKSYEQALELAKTQNKVVFVAVNMDGEKANERMLAKVYGDKAIVELAKLTIDVVASSGEHAPADKPCTKFEGLYCLDHRRIDSALRKELLKPDADGFVVAPQHVFLDPKGQVILSVPYEVSAPELAWCFATALRSVDPASPAPAAGTHAPKRLIRGGVFDPKSAPEGSGRTLSRAEVLDLIKELKKSGRGQWELEKLRALVSSDEPEAREFVLQELKSGGGRGGGGGGRGGGGGGRGGAGPGMGDGGENRHARLMHAIGVLSPPSWWEVAAEFVGDSDDALRAETIVTLEELAAPESLKALQQALASEKEPARERDLLRALASAGSADKGVRATLLKRVKGEKDELARACAIVACGWLASGDDVEQELARLLEHGTPSDKQAAALAMGLARDERYVARLEPASKGADAPLAEVASAALAVARSGDLTRVRTQVKAVCKDTIARERFFGREKQP